MSQYLVPTSVDEALRLLAEHGSHAAFLGGGTSWALRDSPQVETLIDLRALRLGVVERRDALVCIGATTTLEEARRSPHVSGLAGGILERAIGLVRTPAWRNQSTIAGWLLQETMADPIAPTLLVLGAAVVLQRGPRRKPERVPLEDRAQLEAPGLVLHVEIPDNHGWRFALESLSVTATDSPIAAIAVGVSQRDGRVAGARVASTGLGAHARRHAAVESQLQGAAWAAASYASAQRTLVDEITPASDTRASSAYRRHLASVLLARALRRAAAASIRGEV
ncbi:MAG: FAD binding domain-containing protein [Candidatus Latescibacterota bacterium]|nr:MAG: FAD binding domain-containing protein [Candidatus Latescibacterota bacterium]